MKQQMAQPAVSSHLKKIDTLNHQSTTQDLSGINISVFLM